MHPREQNSPEQSDHQESSGSIGDGSRAFNLSVDDFHRLGVRPKETRLTVIRKAAAKSTKSLAERQLTSPSRKTERQLSSIATSTYRLLDPRQRDNQSERTHVGRILPNALRWAARTQFTTRQLADPRPESDASVGSKLIESDAIDDMTVGVSGLELPGDLARQTRLAGRPRHDSWSDWIRRQVNRPIVLGILIIALIGVSAALWSWNWNAKAKIASNQSESTRIDEPASTANKLPQVKPPNVAQDTTVDENPFKEVAAHDDAPWVRASHSLLQPGSRWPEVTEVNEHMQPLLPTELDDDAGLHKLLHALLAQTDPEWLPLLGSIDLDRSLDLPRAHLPGQDGDVIPLQRQAVPEETQIAAARQQLLAILPELDEPIASDAATPLLKDLVSMLDKIEAGSADDWVIRLSMAKVDWLIRDLEFVLVRLTPLTQRFDIELNTLLSESFANMATPADTEDMHEHVIDNGMLLAERLLSAEAWSDCQRVLKTSRQSADYLGQAVRFTVLDQYDEALTTMQRLQVTADDVITEGIDVATPSKAGIAGRYQCLLLRRWDAGLPWLASGNDPRLSMLARDELLMNVQPAVKERIEIARRWLAASKRSRGRESDSMRLHALEQLRIAAEGGKGLQQLEAEGLVEETFDSFPWYLQATDHARKLSIEAPAPRIESIAKPGARGLSGRIRTADGDLGVQLEYETSMEITRELLDQVTTKLGPQEGRWTIELVGQFKIESPSAVRIRVGDTAIGMNQEVWLGKTMITFPPDQPSAVVPILAGSHTIRWRIDADEVDAVFLAVQDAETRKDLRIKPAYQARIDDAPTKLTLKIIRSSQ